MQRRKFIKNTLTGLTLPLIPPALISCEDTIVTPKDKTVIVIGAGIAGLAAAKKLTENGFDVKVLESQEKVGGRLRTNRSLGIAFDEGASWIHGVNKNPITTLAQESGMTTFETVDENRKSYDIGGKIRTAAIYNSAEDELDSIIGSMMKKGSPSESFETVFKRLYPQKFNDRLWRFFLSSYITFDLGDLDKLSSTLYDAGEEFGGAEKIATNGYDTIPNYLAKGLNIQLNERVTMIDYSAEKIKITHNSTITEADYVIVTVPLGVLKNNVIQFLPNLPQNKQNAIQKIGMNCVNKFLLTWDKAFWDDVQYISYTPEERDKFNYFVNIKKFNPATNALMTFAYANYARQTESMSDAQIINEIMKHLRDMYGSNTPNPTNLLRTKWQSNPNTYGSYSFTAVGTEMQHFDDLAATLNNRVFFAGEHTEIDYFSTAHGAYLSGIREADKIIDL
ncbi:MAG: FAD-dependent oxidoreductase [Spirosomaceae bacterium]|jgi:monoamine oxidase|nr:FAD-dependent oxidoreductase [Spirosomataceae bacterium]